MISMKIKCRECKTIYDSSEKYCPYCFSRTKPHDCYHLSMDGSHVEGSAMKKRSREVKQFNYRKRASSKYKKSKPKVNGAEIVAYVFVIIMIMMFLSFFLMIFSF